MTLRIGSLFAGIGGLERGLEMAGLGPVVFQVEIDPTCRRILRKHWPHAWRFNDVTAPNPYPEVDVLCGGPPCQDLSPAGKGAGLAGARSGLWRDFRRVAAELRPRVVVVENVAGARRRWLPTILADLAELGYRARAYALSAADVGAPHLRRRVFVVAHAQREQLREQQQRLPARRERGLRDQGEGVALDAREAGAAAGAPGWPAPPPIPRVDARLPGWLDRERALGNSVVPACGEVIGRIVLEDLQAMETAT